MGEVWRARRGDEPPVALKLLIGDDAGSATQRLLREGDLLTRLVHPNVVRVHEFGVSEGRPYLAMELLEGKPLSDVLRAAGGPLERDLVTRIARGVAQGLAAAHQAGVLHRDIKPSNVLLAGDRVVVLDFGIARVESAAGLTQPGALVGSFLYMSPEQLDAQPLDERSDVYQFGLLMWEVAAGARPYVDLSPPDAVGRRLAQGVPPLPAAAPVAALTARCLETDPARRPASFAQVLESFDEVTLAPDAPEPVGKQTIPRAIGPYAILSQLGQGGMGLVFRARKEGATEDVALKIMFPRFAQDPNMVARFRREIALARAVSHPGVVRVIDDGADGATLWFAMEFVRGQTLQDIVQAEGRVSVDESLAIVSDIAGALDAMHRRGLLHRDLKPANVMLENSGRVRVMDLGMSKSAEGTALTSTGQMVGTPLYYPPEYTDFQTYDERSDLYQVGLILHELVTGRRSFPRSDGARASAPMTDGKLLPVPPEIQKAGVAVAKFYRKLLSPAPGQRYATAEDVARDLAELPAGAVSRSRRMAPPPPPAAPTPRPPAKRVTGSRPLPRPSGRVAVPAPAPTARKPSQIVSIASGVTRGVAQVVNYGILLITIGVALAVLLNLPSIYHRFGAH